MTQYDVVVIGAGPTGLMAAVQLARHGVKFLIIDGKAGPTEQSRAIVMTARSLEIYQQLGISDTALEKGRFIEGFSIFFKGKEKVTVPVGELGKGLTDFSYLLAFEQSRNEELLYEKLKSHGHDVSWHTELAAVDQQADYVDITVKYLQQAGRPGVIRTKYIIGCDGARSVVRQSLGFSFKGGTYEKRFYVADTKLKWHEAYDKLMLFPTRKAFCGIFPMAGNNSHRIIGSIPLKFGDEVNFEQLRSSIMENIGLPVEIEQVNWFAVYKLHHRSVDTFRKGNCFVAGDAAHIHSPAGGQGMNTGLQDAYNLTWKLALVLKGFASEKLLDTYNEERLPFAKWLLKFTDRGFSLMSSSNIFIDWARRVIIPWVAKRAFTNPKTRKNMFRTVSQIKWSYDRQSLSENLSKQKLSFKAGDRLPYILIGSEQKSIYLQLTDPCFYLLLIGDAAEPVLAGFEQLIKIIPLSPGEWKQLGVTAPLSILVRPDNYIGLVADELTAAILKDYFLKHCYITIT